MRRRVSGRTQAVRAIGSTLVLFGVLAAGPVRADDGVVAPPVPADTPPADTPPADTPPATSAPAEPVVDTVPSTTPADTADTVPEACADGEAIELGDGTRAVCWNGAYVAQGEPAVPSAEPPAVTVVDDVEVGVGPAPVPAPAQVAPNPAPTTVAAPAEPELVVDEVAAEIVVVDIVLAAWG